MSKPFCSECGRRTVSCAKTEAVGTDCTGCRRRVSSCTCLPVDAYSVVRQPRAVRVYLDGKGVVEVAA